MLRSPFVVGLLSLAALASLTSAQILIPPAAVPPCASGCGALNQASMQCLPPQVPVSNQPTYDSCFCHSQALASLNNNPNGICDQECPVQSDRLAIQNWYRGKCAGIAPPPAGAPTTPPPPAQTTAPTTDPKAAPSSAGKPAKYVAPKEPSWISGHWQYIIMLIVILLGLVALAIVGVWLRRRHERKHPIHRQRAVPGDPGAAEEGSSGPKPGSSEKPETNSATSSTILGGIAGLASAAVPPWSRSGNTARNGNGADPAGAADGQRSRNSAASGGFIRRLSSRLSTRPQSNGFSPVVTGPQFHQAQTKGYEYPTDAGDAARVPTPPTMGDRGLGVGGGNVPPMVPEEHQLEFGPEPGVPMNQPIDDRIYDSVPVVSPPQGTGAQEIWTDSDLTDQPGPRATRSNGPLSESRSVLSGTTVVPSSASVGDGR